MAQMRRVKISLILTLLPFTVAGCGPHSSTNSTPTTDLSAAVSKLHSVPTQQLTQSDVAALLLSGNYDLLQQYFSKVQRSYHDGQISDEDLRGAFRAFYDTSGTLEPAYDAWVHQYPRSYVALLARGIYYKRIGQERRGDGLMRDTSFWQLLGMESAYHQAFADFQASEALDDRPLLTYMHMMDISSQVGDANQNRDILDAAIRIDPANFIVRQKYMISLESKWGGSREKMQEFLEECRHAQLGATALRKLEAVVVEGDAWVAYISEDYAAAAAGYRRALDMGGETVCLQCASYAMTDQKLYVDAIRVYTLILRDNPSDTNTLGQRAYAYSQLQDPKAFEDFTAAANLGDAYSQNALGQYTYNGVPGHIPRDRDRAIAWFRKAAAQGNEEGKKNLAIALADN
jgi:TPR repeat protein